MLGWNIVLLTMIHPLDVKPGSPLGAFREEQAMSQHRVSTSLSLSSSSHTTQLHYTNSYMYSHPNLNFLQYTTRNVVCPSGENRPYSTPSIRLTRNPKHVIVQWVGIGTHTHTSRFVRLQSYMMRGAYVRITWCQLTFILTLGAGSSLIHVSFRVRATWLSTFCWIHRHDLSVWRSSR